MTYVWQTYIIFWKNLNFLLTTDIKSSILISVERNGRIAQLVEHLPYKQRVIGSSPIATTILYGLVVQLVRTLACHARGRRFEPVPGRHFYFIINGFFIYIWLHSSVGRAEDWKSSCQWFDSTWSHQTIICTKKIKFFINI